MHALAKSSIAFPPFTPLQRLLLAHHLNLKCHENPPLSPLPLVAVHSDSASLRHWTTKPAVDPEPSALRQRGPSSDGAGSTDALERSACALLCGAFQDDSWPGARLESCRRPAGHG